MAEVRARFGPGVAEIVSDYTDAWTEPKPEWRRRKEAYLAALPDKPKRSLLVSLADKTHNAEAILFDYQAFHDELWDRFNRGSGWYSLVLQRTCQVFLKHYARPTLGSALTGRRWLCRVTVKHPAANRTRIDPATAKRQTNGNRENSKPIA